MPDDGDDLLFSNTMLLSGDVVADDDNNNNDGGIGNGGGGDAAALNGDMRDETKLLSSFSPSPVCLCDVLMCFLFIKNKPNYQNICQTTKGF